MQAYAGISYSSCDRFPSKPIRETWHRCPFESKWAHARKKHDKQSKPVESTYSFSKEAKDTGPHSRDLAKASLGCFGLHGLLKKDQVQEFTLSDPITNLWLPKSVAPKMAWDTEPKRKNAAVCPGAKTTTTLFSAPIFSSNRLLNVNSGALRPGPESEELAQACHSAHRSASAAEMTWRSKKPDASGA